jgi:anti-anti-sigma regulatory factor
MAGNFRVLVHRNSDSVHLRLEGDFDGSSAQQLLCMLGENGTKVKRVFIHTNGLKEIDPFGKAVFQKNLNDFNRTRADLVFTGDRGPEIAPQGHRLIA